MMVMMMGMMVVMMAMMMVAVRNFRPCSHIVNLPEGKAIAMALVIPINCVEQCTE